MHIVNHAGHSDVHLGVKERPRFRARGEIDATDCPATDDMVFQGWLHEILSPQQIDSFFRDKELDSVFAFPFVHVRINVLDSLRGSAMVRLIPQTILTIEDPVEFVHESRKCLIRRREVGLNILQVHHALGPHCEKSQM